MREVAQLVGRDRELVELSEAFDAARSGRAHAVLLTGEAGIGKSRLAREAIAESGFAFCMGRARQEATPPYGPITAALRTGLPGRAAFRELPRSLAGALAMIMPEVGVPEADAPKDALIEAIAAAFTLVKNDRPIAVVIEDLQWADEATLDLLPPLLERLHRSDFFVLGSYRSDEITRAHPLRRLRNELHRDSRLQEIQVGPLTPKECKSLIQAMLPKPPSRALTDQICVLTDGVPLYVEELAGALAESGRLRDGEDGLELVPGSNWPIPQTIRDAVVLRLAGLSRIARRQLEAAAVVGTDLDLEIVRRLVPGEQALDELVVGNWLVGEGVSRASFRHALIREAILDEARPDRLRDLNRLLAEQLERAGERPGLIAEHWLAARDLPAARAAWIESAERSCRVHAYRDATRAAGKALEIWPKGEDQAKRIEVLERLAHCAQISGQLPEAIAALLEVLGSRELDREPERRAKAHRSLAEAYGLVGEVEPAIASRRESARAFEEARLPAEAAIEFIALADRCATLLRVSPGVEAIRRALELADVASRVDLRAHATSLHGLLLASGGRAPEGIRLAKEALDLALEHGLVEVAAAAHRRLGVCFNYNSDYRTAGESFAQAIQYCRTHGNEAQRELCLGCMAWAHYQMADWKSADELCREVLDQPKAPAGLRAIATGVPGLIRAVRGELKSARRMLTESLGLTPPGELVAMKLIVLGGLAYVAELEGNEDDACRHYRTLLELWVESDDRLDAAGGLTYGTIFFAERNMEPELSRSVEALTRMAATDNPEARAALALGLGETALMRGEASRAAEFFERALGNLEGLELPVNQVATKFRAGAASLRAGDRERGLEHLRSAHREAKRLGARPLAARIAAEITAAGFPVGEERSPEGADRSERAGLTRRQLEVIRRVSEGLTNREIGELLFVSTRTVDMHVRNLLDRLDCRTRAEAVSKAGALGLLE